MKPMGLFSTSAALVAAASILRFTSAVAQEEVPSRNEAAPPQAAVDESAPDSSGASSDSPAADTPKVEDLGNSRYRYGSIEFNGKTREIRLPTQVNMSEGIIEYAVVHGQGKIHESLLVTEVVPSHLQTVLKLCRYKSGEGDVFDPFYPEDQRKGAEGAKDRGTAIAISVEWEETGERKAQPLSHWIYDRKTQQSMSDSPWIFTGSYFYSGTFMADADGLLVSIYLSSGSILNPLAEGTEDDERWLAHADHTPEIGTPVTLVLAPAAADSPEEKDQ